MRQLVKVNDQYCRNREKVDYDHQRNHFTSPAADALNASNNDNAGNNHQHGTDNEFQEVDIKPQKSKGHGF